MFIENLINDRGTDALNGLLQFTAARHKLLAENIVNIDTPEYKQKDLSLDKFQSLLQTKLDHAEETGERGNVLTNLQVAIEHPNSGILMHDGNNRSMEQLMSDQAKNALMHNFAIEMLRKQYSQMEMAIKEKVG